MGDWRERARINQEANDWVAIPPGTFTAHPPEATTEWLVEGRYDEARHPRGRGGKWIDVLGGNLDKATTLGVTPFLTDRTEASGRPYRDLAPGQPITDFGHAAKLHADKKWEPLFKAFEQDTEKLAKQHGVEIVRGERNVGVYMGNFEPSYAISVTGPKKKIDAYNRALGERYRQKAVVSFQADPKGTDAELRFSGGKDPNEFFGDLVSVMGEEAGASFDADTWRVFVFHGNAESSDQATRLIALAKKRGMNVSFVAGRGDYFELRGGKG